MKSLALTLSAIALTVTTAFAGPYTFDSKKVVKEVIVEDVCNFRDFELQLDGYFAGVAAGRTSGQLINSGVGGGVGLNVIFAKYFGLGAEYTAYSNDGVAEHLIIGNFFLRYPICSLNLAPYAMVGGGAGWDGTSIGYGHVGGGIEWRPLPNVGWFADGRWMYGAPDNFVLMRTGLRFAF